jgi:glutamyl/glutaminyl-tRNA synthetase
MSKRKDPVSLTDDFRAKGYLPEAMMNFLALLGWSSTSGKEIFSQRELINEFSLERVGKSPSIFDINRLNYLNGYYIRKLQIGDLAKRIYPFLSDKYKKGLDKEYYLKVVSLIQDRIKRLDEINDLVSFFFEKELEYPTQLIIEKSSDSETTKKLLKEALDELTESNFDYDDLDKRLRNLANRNKVKAGVILWAVRAAITGKKASPGVFEVLKVLGKEKSIACIKKAIDILQ